MKILYIFPHPDDESFGPALAIAQQVRQGHSVHLLTLTKGGATKVRHEYGWNIEQMGNARFKEMLKVREVLGLSGMTVLDLPDGGLKEIDPRIIESVIEEEIHKVKPEVVVTYAVHGISGFHDHLVSHAVVKRVFHSIRDKKLGYPRRLALFTVSAEQAEDAPSYIPRNFSKPEEIDCIYQASEEDRKKFLEALDCYETYTTVINNSRIKEMRLDEVNFEIYQEDFKPPLNDLFASLP